MKVFKNFGNIFLKSKIIKTFEKIKKKFKLKKIFNFK